LPESIEQAKGRSPVAGFFERRKQKKAEEAHQEAVKEWETEVEEVSQLISDGEALSSPDFAGESAMLAEKPGEKVFMELGGCGLVEPRKGRGQYVGGTSGVSFRIMKGVHYRVGQQKGTYQSGPEEQTMIDQGTAVLTNQRVVFMGPKYTREWLFSKIVGHYHDGGATYIHVSNRQKVSGIYYGDVPQVRFRIDFAIALQVGQADQMLDGVRSELRELEGQKPQLQLPR
jgi:hypothetical protein